MRDTKIQWCDSTVNPVMGCDGCELWTAERRSCYAGILHKMRSGHRGYASDFNVAQEFPGRMADAAKWSDLRGTERPTKPWLNGYPRLIFVSDMGDALSRNIGFEFLFAEIIDAVTSIQGKRHIWQWLTKQPRRMFAFSNWLRERGVEWPSNLWAMTSVTGAGTETRVRDICLVGDENTIRGVSFEPLSSEPNWRRCFDQPQGRVHWAIFGGTSGGTAEEYQANLRWFSNGIDAAREFDAAPFMKQLGSRPVVEVTIKGDVKLEPYAVMHSHGGDWCEWPDPLRVRELPMVV